MDDYREKYCRSCRSYTKHCRDGWESLERSPRWQFFVALGSVWCLWPIVCPAVLLLGLLLSLPYALRPFRCLECGRRNRRWGGRPVPVVPAGVPQPHDEPSYQYDEIRLVRRAPVAAETDLVGPIDRVVRAIQREGGAYRLYGRSPSLRLLAVRRWWRSIVWKFVTTSEIQWNHGRLPGDPTHEVVFYNVPGSVFLLVQFVVAGAEATCPGLVAKLSLRTAARPRRDRTARLERLFSRLIEILQPDYGDVVLPGHSDAPGWPNAPDAGWLTYLKRPESADRLSVPPPSTAVPFAGGVMIRAAPGPAPADYGAAEAITALREVVRSAWPGQSKEAMPR